MKLTEEAKSFLLNYDSTSKDQDLFTLDYRKLHRKLKQFPNFSFDLFIPTTQNNFHPTCQILKIWFSPIFSLIKELISTPQISEFDSFFKNALYYLEIELKAMSLMDLFPSDSKLFQYYSNSLQRLSRFIANMHTLKLLFKTQKQNTSLYLSTINEIYGFSLDLLKIFEPFFHLFPLDDQSLLKHLLVFLAKHLDYESIYLPSQSSTIGLADIRDSCEELDPKFKENYTSKTLLSVMNMPFSYLSCLERKNELLEYTLEQNAYKKSPTKSEIEVNPNFPTQGNSPRRQRILSRISQKIRSYQTCNTFIIDDKEKNFESNRVVWLSEAEMIKIEKNKKEENMKMEPPSFANSYHSQKKEISEIEKEQLKDFNESNVFGCINYDEVKFEEKIELKSKKPYSDRLARNEEKKANLMKFQKKLLRLQDDKDFDFRMSSVYESTGAKDIIHPSVPTERGSLLMNAASSFKRNSKKLANKIIVKDSYEQMKDNQKKNQTILKTFKKSKEKSKVRYKKKNSVITIIKINGVSFQEPEDIIGKNQAAALTPEFVKDNDEEDVISNDSSTSSDNDEKEYNNVLERKAFLNSLFQGNKPRLTIKRHSKILSGNGKSDEKEKVRKPTEKKNLFQSWHMIEDIDVMTNVSAFNVNTSRESVNFFIIRFLINRKLKTHEYKIHLKIIQERWNKIKFAFQIFMLYRKLNEKKVLSFFDEAHLIVAEMRTKSFLHKFDQFLYLIERNVEDIFGGKKREEFFISSKTNIELSERSKRSQSRNINQVLLEVEIDQKILILERSVKNFTPIKYWNNGKRFLLFDSKTIEDKANEKMHPDILLL